MDEIITDDQRVVASSAPHLHRSLGARLGRRRFLGIVGTAFFAMVGKMVVPNQTTAAPTPDLCYGADGCDTCNGTSRCQECFNGPAYTCGGNQCWTVAGPIESDGCRTYFECCDWKRSDSSVCICRGVVHRSCEGNTSTPRPAPDRTATPVATDPPVQPPTIQPTLSPTIQPTRQTVVRTRNPTSTTVPTTPSSPTRTPINRATRQPVTQETRTPVEPTPDTGSVPTAEPSERPERTPRSL